MLETRKKKTKPKVLAGGGNLPMQSLVGAAVLDRGWGKTLWLTWPFRALCTGVVEKFGPRPNGSAPESCIKANCLARSGRGSNCERHQAEALGYEPPPRPPRQE